jgi:formate/nitrite transporter FocA (FNT family)
MSKAEKEAEKREEKEIIERASPPGRIVYHAIVKEGEGELERPSSALFWSGLAAGLSMGFSMITEALLQTYLPDAPWRPLISKLGYSVGFIIAILGRQQLFTENTLTPILPLLKNKTLSVFANVMRLWAVVLFANLLGAFGLSWALAHTNVFDPNVKAAFFEIGNHAMSHGAINALWRGVFAGWLIALIVWMMPFAEVARFWVIIMLTYIIGLGGLTHIVAGSVVTFTLAAGGQRGWGDVFVNFTLPVLVGNIIGGVMLVAALNHAQVVAGKSGGDI